MPSGVRLVNVDRDEHCAMAHRFKSGKGQYFARGPVRQTVGSSPTGGMNSAKRQKAPSERARDVRFRGGEECKAGTWHLDKAGCPLCLVA